MAFSAIHKYTLFLESLIVGNHAQQNDYSKEYTKEERHIMHSKDRLLCSILTEWYETLKDMPKFKVQRDNAKAVLIKHYPAYSQGYFKLKNKTDAKTD